MKNKKSPIKRMFDDVGIKKKKIELTTISAKVEKDMIIVLDRVIKRNGVKSRSKLINDLLKKWIEIKG